MSLGVVFDHSQRRMSADRLGLVAGGWSLMVRFGRGLGLTLLQIR